MQKSVLRSLMMLVVLMSGTLFAAAQATEPVKGVVRVKLQPEVARSLGRKSVRVQNGQPVTRYTQLDQALQTAKASASVRCSRVRLTGLPSMPSSVSTVGMRSHSTNLSILSRCVSSCAAWPA